MVLEQAESWGRLFRQQAESFAPPSHEALVETLSKGHKSLLPYGLGRSYGDSCLNLDGALLKSTHFDHFIEFDQDEGILRVEGGVTVADILRVIVPKGYFLPVTPGTKYVTIAGAVANDVHGKNHFQDGTIGCHVTRFELLRSTGAKLICSPHEHGDLFKATIGGLGLTGFMTWVELKLKKGSGYFDVETVKFRNLDEFFAISEESNEEYCYTMSWVDCLAKGSQLGRGIFMRGNHATNPPAEPCEVSQRPRVAVPFEFPNFALNKFSIRLFNEVYFNKFRAFNRSINQHFEPFFYPLDAVHQWNYIYGKRGFFQYQFVVPRDAKDTLVKIFERIALSQQGSFLAVFKEFGDRESPGLLSFPKPGYTLALDFANLGDSTLQLLTALDELVLEVGGSLYPAKDARMTSEVFRTCFPNYMDIEAHRDPAFSSTFWQRVTRD